MVQLADGSHLTLKPRDARLVLHLVLGQHLDRDDLVELRVPRLVDRSHATFANLRQQLVIPQADQTQSIGG